MGSPGPREISWTRLRRSGQHGARTNPQEGVKESSTAWVRLKKSPAAAVDGRDGEDLPWLSLKGFRRRLPMVRGGKGGMAGGRKVYLPTYHGW